MPDVTDDQELAARAAEALVAFTNELILNAARVGVSCSPARLREYLAFAEPFLAEQRTQDKATDPGVLKVSVGRVIASALLAFDGCMTQGMAAIAEQIKAAPDVAPGLRAIVEQMTASDTQA